MLEPTSFDVRPEQVENEGPEKIIAHEAMEEATIEIDPLMPEKVLVNGIELSVESALRALKSACTFYEFSTSGGKDKCYKRLVNHQKRLGLMQ